MGRRTMRFRPYLVCLPLLALAGCSKSAEDRNLELEQQKLTVQLLNSQREQLAFLTEREKAVADAEKKNAETVKQIDSRQRDVDLASRELAAGENALREKEAKIANREAEISTREEQIRLEEQKVEQRMQAVNSRLAEMQRAAAADAQRAANEARAREEGQRPEIIARLKQRQPDLDRLIDLTTDVAIHISNLVKSTFRKGLAKLFEDPKWGAIPDEDEFSHEAVNAALGYVSSQVGKTYFEVNSALYYRPMNEWRNKYLGIKEDSSKPAR
jgi:hypothetical protein